MALLLFIHSVVAGWTSLQVLSVVFKAVAIIACDVVALKESLVLIDERFALVKSPVQRR